MSLRTFTDNVINLAVESCLVRHIPEVLTPRSVEKMGIGELNELAAESEALQRQRLHLQEQVRILSEGLLKFQRHKPSTPSSTLPSLPPSADIASSLVASVASFETAIIR
jgi:hypothetical protein